MTPNSGLSIIIPAYNEAGSIQDTVFSMLSELGQLSADFELILVDDGSRDGTGRIIESLAAADNRILVVTLPANQGKGAALRAGFAHASEEWILFLDADGQVPLSEARTLLPYAGPSEMIIGFRTSLPRTIVRKIMSRTYNWLIAWTLGIRVRDIGCPCKLFRRSLLELIDLRSRGFLLDAELLYQAISRGVLVQEIPVLSRPRRTGSSTVRLRHVFQTLWELFLLILRTQLDGFRKRKSSI
jgi:glycosyltransferase involved in cell wall biosynthesis